MLLATGLSEHAFAIARRRGALTQVRHGAYSDLLAEDLLQRHRQLVAGTWPLLEESAVLSHGSAAVLHGLPVWEGQLTRVSITRSGGGHGVRGRQLHVRLGPLEPFEVAELEGYRVTVLERTACDLARQLSYDHAVAVLDAALHSGARSDLLAATTEAAKGRTGVDVLRQALEFADGRAESVGESISRVRLAQTGLPSPQLQYTVLDAVGRFVARADFGWESKRVLGEFDGRVKYLGTADEVADTVMREKRREDAIRDNHWWVVRWGWRDLEHPERLRRRVLAAFESAEALRRLQHGPNQP